MSRSPENRAIGRLGANNQGQRQRYKAALVDTLRRDGGDYHIVAQLQAGASRAALEDALYAWVARVDRFYLGRSWSGPHRTKDRMQGVVFFETSAGFQHAHVVARRPATASVLHFMLNARFLFQAHPNQCLRHLHPRPIAPRGMMKVWRIGPTESDLDRVLNYVAKGLEATIDRCDWKFLDELSPRQV